MHTLGLLILLSAAAGAISVTAPDHWVPASVLSWQRRWSPLRSALFAGCVLSVHVALGVALYFAFGERLRAFDSAWLFPFAVVFVVAFMLLRGLRFSRIRDIQRLGPHTVWGTVLVLTLLGPSEAIIPIFLKSASLGVGYLIPLIAFAAGTLIVGVSATLSGSLMWNRPRWLVRGFDWANRRLAILPMAAGVAVGLKYLVRL